MPMDPEERELTILITKLNANLQIQLTQTVGLAALSIASFVASYQSGIPWYVANFLSVFAVLLDVSCYNLSKKVPVELLKKLRELK